MRHKFLWVDAFTTTKFGGNPCAVVFSADSLSSEQMQTVAKEMNLSETAFIVKSSRADFGARYFTPAEEIPLAGHPTISTIHSLIDEGQIDLGKTKSLSLELKAGVVPIDIALNSDRTIKIVMSQRKPQFLSKHDSKTIAEIFGLQISDLLPDAPVQTVSTGTPQLMVPVKGKSVLKKAQFNVSKYLAYKAKSDFFSPHVFCLEGETKEGSTFARHFGCPPDTFEDPFTGSATGGMAAFLWHYGLIAEPKFIAEQGHWLGRPGKAFVEVVGPKDNIETVKVGGSAVTLVRGEIEI